MAPARQERDISESVAVRVELVDIAADREQGSPRFRSRPPQMEGSALKMRKQRSAGIVDAALMPVAAASPSLSPTPDGYSEPPRTRDEAVRAFPSRAFHHGRPAKRSRVPHVGMRPHRSTFPSPPRPRGARPSIADNSRRRSPPRTPLGTALLPEELRAKVQSEWQARRQRLGKGGRAASHPAQSSSGPGCS